MAKKKTSSKEEVIKKSPEIVPRETFCGCGHDKELHYGGDKGHCNAQGCYCMEFK
jgi:hypothetical protein